METVLIWLTLDWLQARNGYMIISKGMSRLLMLQILAVIVTGFVKTAHSVVCEVFRGCCYLSIK
jgi:hypothetical protein